MDQSTLINQSTTMDNNISVISQMDPSPHPLSSRDVVVASVYIIEAVILIPLHLLCSYLMHKDKEMQNATYYFMINLGIADIIELLAVGVYAGVVILMGGEEDPLMARIASFLCLAAWYANCVLFPLIAFTRWVAITKPHLVATVFRKRVLWPLHIGAWLVLGIPAFYGNILHAEGRLFPFNPSFYTWSFAANSVGVAFNWLNIVFDSCCTTVEMGFNIISLIWVHKTRKQVHQNLATTENRRREIKLLVQCVILGCIFTSTYIFFTIVSAFKLVVTVPLCLALQAVWTFNHSVNPLVYLTVNARLRRRAWRIVTCGGVKANGGTVAQISTMKAKQQQKDQERWATVKTMKSSVQNDDSG